MIDTDSVVRNDPRLPSAGRILVSHKLVSSVKLTHIATTMPNSSNGAAIPIPVGSNDRKRRTDNQGGRPVADLVQSQGLMRAQLGGMRGTLDRLQRTPAQHQAPPHLVPFGHQSLPVSQVQDALQGIHQSLPVSQYQDLQGMLQAYQQQHSIAPTQGLLQSVAAQPQSDSIKDLVDKLWSDDHTTVEAAVKKLYKLITTPCHLNRDKNKKDFFDAGGHIQVFKILENSVSQADRGGLIEQCFRMLTALAREDQRRCESMANYPGVIQLSVQAMTKFPNERVYLAVFKMLDMACVHNSFKSAILKAGAIPVILDTMKANEENVVIQEFGCALLHKLLQSNNVPLTNMGLSIVQLPYNPTSHMQQLYMQQLGMDVNNQHSVIRNAVNGAGGLSVLAAAKYKFSCNAGIQMSTTFCINSLNNNV